jgi:hypothetical protein
VADRYWVGGTAAWDGTAGTKWALTSGGAGGQSVPTSADDVFFDAASGAVTVTVSGTQNSRSLNFTGFTGTITGTGSLQVYGNLVLASGVTWSHTGNVLMTASSGSWTVTTAGKTLGANTSFAIGTATWTLQDALTVTGSLTVNGGTFTTNNFNVTALQLVSNNSNVRTINLGSSTVTFSTTGTAVNLQTNTNLTFNAGTSTIIVSGAGANLTGGSASAAGVTFYNVSFTSTTASTYTINGINTFNNLSVASPSTVGVMQLQFDSRQTINGTLSTTGTAGNRRVWFRGATYGLAQTLTINSAPSLTDADFRDIYVIGTAAPISGTRIGDLRGCSGITFSTPKTVYWNLAGTQSWSANGWATTSTGSPSTDNFPLAQDTATFTNAGSVTGPITINSDIPTISAVDMSGRTSAMTLSIGANITIYGDWKNGSGTTISGSGTLIFLGRNTQTITSAGRSFNNAFTIDTYGGTVELADALNISSNTLTVTNGTFDTKNYNVTAGTLSSSNSNVRAITLGSSTVSLSSVPITFTTSTNLTFNAGTSQINVSATNPTLNGGGVTFYNLAFTSAVTTATIVGENTFNNFTFTGPASAGISTVSFSNDQTITGTLTCSGATAVRRIFPRSNTPGTTRKLTVGTLSANDCDFRDITIAGTAAGSSPTRAGDCGGNSGITFPAPKTVYWNLAGTQDWSATAWAPGSGGTPDINNFPLAQDTAVFDNAGSAGTVTVNAAWNIGTFDASLRTSAMTFTIVSVFIPIYGDWKFGTGVTSSIGSGELVFSGRVTQTITSNGVTFGRDITINLSTVQLADALTLNSSRTLNITNGGTFDAVSYNVTTGLFTVQASGGTLKMGSGTWTLSGTGTVWNTSLPSALNFYKGTANIVLSDTSTTSRQFAGGGLSFNKLTIGGTTGISTTTITSNNQFTELASTKTVAHTIALGTTNQTFGAWTVSGTSGNVVTVTGTGVITIAGARVSGVNFLAMGTTLISTTSPGEFYAGPNSTGNNVILTSAPAAVTRYWRGGTGTWDAITTTNWSASSGGPGGASVPTSADTVIFDSASNATAYTVTCTATQLRCGSLTFSGPASGNVTWAGTDPIAAHGNVTLPATGLTRTYTGTITLSGSTTGKTFTTNGVTLASVTTVNGVDCEWSLGSALNNSLSGFTLTNGSFNTANYNLTAGSITSVATGSRTLSLGSSVVSISTPPDFGNTETIRAALTFTAGTSQINFSNASPTLSGNNQTFYNVSFTSTALATATINGLNTFNDLSVTGRTSAGIGAVSLNANQTINGTLTLSAGTDATMRTFVRSDTIGTTRTLTCAAVAALTDIDFRDITIAGTAAPVSGTRLGDCKGNSGITFPAAKTVFYRSAASSSSFATWSFTNGGTSDITAFPLAQDTAVFPSSPTPYPTSGNVVALNTNYNLGTIDMSARTSNTMTLATGIITPTIYGNWINGTGTTLTGTGALTFAGRGSQTITSAGKTFGQGFLINTPGGSVTLQDAFTGSFTGINTINLFAGTFDANGYNVTVPTFGGSGTAARTAAIGSGTWTLSGSGSQVWNFGTSTNLTVTGTGTISLTSASAKTFAGGGVSYSGITLDQGGAGTLTISGNNTFANITNTFSATDATTIALGTTTQTVGAFTATGESGRVLTITGTSAISPATLILTSGTVTTPNFLAITGIRAYNLVDTWYAGNNSTNNGSLGWIFSASPVSASNSNFFLMFA